MTKQDMLLKVANLERSPLFLANVCAATRMAMKKTASPMNDLAGNIVSNAYLPYAGAVASDIGSLAGMVSNPTTEAEEAAMDRNTGTGFLPGVGAYRLERRLKRQTQDDQGGTPHYWSQRFGGLTSGLLASGLGAGIGAGAGAITGALNGEGAGRGAGIGTGIGAIAGLGTAGLATLASAIAAGINRRRTREEQKAYANSSTAPEWLVPGMAAYGRLKSFGRAQGDAEERIKG